MIISVASGKGGTGKTTVAVNLALSISNKENVQLLDCDVEEPNAHIFLKPSFAERLPVYIPVPQVDEKKCTYCGKCAEVCAFHAIAVLKGNVLTFSQLCHGCGGCALFCPEEAITEINREIGIVEKGESFGMEFIHGKLAIGEAMAPPVIKAVKKHINNSKIVILDVPPGTSCPVIEAVKGSDFSILVTEPTPFGLNDLILAVEVLREIKIPFGVVINRADVGDDEVEKYCRKENIPILLKIPMDNNIARSYSNGIPVVQAMPEWKQRFQQLFEEITKLINITV
jgi:MinD superfamily P-loop ATPase